MSELTFYERVNELQNELVAPKSNYNNFGKYKYRSAEDILEAVKPLNQKYGVILFLSDEPVFVGEWHYIKATAKLVDAKDPNFQIEATAYARESLNKKGMDDSQITGTASSYARKYALNGLYLIDDTKDADTDEYQKQNDKKQNPPKQPSENQLEIQNKIGALMKRTGKKKGDAIKELGYTNKQFTDLYNGSAEKQKELMTKLEDALNDYQHAG